MVTIWRYRGDHRALWAVIAAIIASYVLSLRLARWDAPWEWVLVALPIAVLLIWFLLARAPGRALGFPERSQRQSAAQGPLGGLAALVLGGALAAIAAAVLAGADAVESSGPAGAAASGSAAGAAAAGPAVIAALWAGAQEVVHRGALLRLAQARWGTATVIGVSGGLSAFGSLPLLLTTDGTWGWLGARVAGLLVMGLVLAWAAVRTGALWMPLGWHVGAGAAAAAALPSWPAQAIEAWTAAGVVSAGHLLLIPVVLLLERAGTRPARGRAD
ncbi:type II CAAX prenyl endopeptidase Rce1 family protein [Kocuria palustris]|uniref:CPBP family glutamic-type intramembrane protease n=1 Tax=Kocuria palustris TaxID=71999 RepID=UPI00119F5E1F|nr:CPBP family glutamic-type intramembrane protease [Kocuria palustris]